MLNKNQIKRLRLHNKRQQRKISSTKDPAGWWRIKGWIEALNIVLNGDETTMNDKPINNKETVNATRSDVDKSTNTEPVR